MRAATISDTGSDRDPRWRAACSITQYTAYDYRSSWPRPMPCWQHTRVQFRNTQHSRRGAPGGTRCAPSIQCSTTMRGRAPLPAPCYATRANTPPCTTRPARHPCMVTTWGPCAPLPLLLWAAYRRSLSTHIDASRVTAAAAEHRHPLYALQLHALLVPSCAKPASPVHE